MKNKYLDEFTTLIREIIPSVPIIEYRVKDNSNIIGLILTIIDSGLTSSLLKIFEKWSLKHSSANIKISYDSHDGKRIEITYNNLNKKDTEKILMKNPPKTGNKIKLELPPF